MSSAADIAAKNAEFQTAVTELETANATYEATKAPYLAAKQALIDAIDKVDALDGELETLTADYEPQSKPENA